MVSAQPFSYTVPIRVVLFNTKAGICFVLFGGIVECGVGFVDMERSNPCLLAPHSIKEYPGQSR